MPIEFIFAIVGGLLCGFLNTVASSGSAVTLPLLIFMGLTPLVANATNRVPVLIAALIASIAFLRAGVIDWKLAIKILLPSTLGSVIGAYFANKLPENDTKLLIVIAVLFAFLLLFSGLKKILERELKEGARYRIFEVLILFAVGFWLGLIVLDGATYLLLALIVFVRLPLVKANAYKNLTILSTSVIALGSFAWGVMLIGSLVGSWVLGLSLEVSWGPKWL